MGPALLCSRPQGQLTCTLPPGPALLCFPGRVQGLPSSPERYSQEGVGPSLHSRQTSTCSQAAAQSREVQMVFGGHVSHEHLHLLLQGHGPQVAVQAPQVRILLSTLWSSVHLSSLYINLLLLSHFSTMFAHHSGTQCRDTCGRWESECLPLAHAAYGRWTASCLL